jgi:hypothetical protein
MTLKGRGVDVEYGVLPVKVEAKPEDLKKVEERLVAKTLKERQS